MKLGPARALWVTQVDRQDDTKPRLLEELSSLYSQWPTEKLVAAISVDPDQYTPAALDVMRVVLSARHLPAAELDNMAAAIRSEDRDGLLRLSTISGWLIVFIVWLLFNSLGHLLGAYNSLTAAGQVEHMLWPAQAVMGICAGFCLALFGRRSRRAPQWTRVYLSLQCSLYVAIYLATGWAPTPLTPLFQSGLWFAYLSRSKRVAAVCGSAVDGKFRADLLVPQPTRIIVEHQHKLGQTGAPTP